ncbi:hypothetical protein ACFE04_017303 [Oxalis oulophora]
MDSAGERQAIKEGLSNTMHLMNGFIDSMTLKCAIELRIADIIHSQGKPISLSKIASLIDSPSDPDISYLARIMRFLVLKKVFAIHHSPNGGEPLYDLTYTSRCFVHDGPFSLAPMILLFNHPLLMAPWHNFSQIVRQGGSAFKMTHGTDIWELNSKNHEVNKSFNDGMACGKILSDGILETYIDGLSSLIGTLIDVGGGTGSFIAKIVNMHPHIKGINFDLPQVIDTSPQRKGVTHISGDMFVSIPKADAIIMKAILHDWNDNECIKILQNCKKAIPEDIGKLIIVDIVLQPGDDEPLDDIRLMADLYMLANCSGKERSEVEWKYLLVKSGFPRYKIIKNADALYSIIEVYTY